MPFLSKSPTLPYDPPDSIAIADFVFNDKYRGCLSKSSKSPFTYGLSEKTFSTEDVKDRVDLFAKGLAKDLGWKPNTGTEWDKVLGVFSPNSVSGNPSQIIQVIRQMFILEIKTSDCENEVLTVTNLS